MVSIDSGLTMSQAGIVLRTVYSNAAELHSWALAWCHFTDEAMEPQRWLATHPSQPARKVQHPYQVVCLQNPSFTTFLFPTSGDLWDTYRYLCLNCARAVPQYGHSDYWFPILASHQNLLGSNLLGSAYNWVTSQTSTSEWPGVEPQW